MFKCKNTHPTIRLSKKIHDRVNLINNYGMGLLFWNIPAKAGIKKRMWANEREGLAWFLMVVDRFVCISNENLLYLNGKNICGINILHNIYTMYN